MELDHAIAQIAIWALPVIFAITLHEAAHGYAAKHFGDMTAYQAGRISLNPLRHIDPVGTILVPLVIYTLSVMSGGPGFLFGWAKPVPVNFGQLRNPKKDMFWVAAAGPMANLTMAIGWIILIKLALVMPDNYFAIPMIEMGKAGIIINVVLMVLNLLPLPPLDGGRIAVSLLPSRFAYRFARIEPYGMMILILLFITHILDYILVPLVLLVIGFLSLISGMKLLPLFIGS